METKTNQRKKREKVGREQPIHNPVHARAGVEVNTADPGSPTGKLFSFMRKK